MPAPLTLNQQPPYMLTVCNNTIHTLSDECIGPEVSAIDTAIAAAAWTANLLTFLPFILSDTIVVSQFFWINGATLNGNTDVGIYSEDGQTKIGSTGSTGNSGSANTVQIVNVADFILPANVRLWLALGSDSGTQTYHSLNLVTTGLDYIGVKQQASGWSSGLPTTATFATPSVAVTPWFGFTAQSVI